MRVLVLLLLLGLQGCADNRGQNNFILCKNDELCGSCRQLVQNHDCYCQSDVNETCRNIVTSFFNECAISSPCTMDRNSELADSRTQQAVLVLGSLTELLLVLLVLVVTGWVWTCWTTKKRKEKTQHCKNCQESDSEEERFCPNQIYKMTTTQPVIGTAIEQPLDSLEESGQSINGFSSKDIKGCHGVNRVENFYSSSEGSNNSSLQDQQRVNRVKEGDCSGEKHMYHVLEKIDGAVYEELDKTTVENTAMELLWSMKPMCHVE